MVHQARDSATGTDGEVIHEATVCIPWRATPSRKPAFDYCVQHWRELGFPVVWSDSDPDKPFLCAQARNRAIAKADTSHVIVADGDMVIDRVEQIDEAVSYDDGVTWPFTIFRHIDGSEPGDRFRDMLVNSEYRASPGGIFVMPKATWAYLGGFDENFTPGCWGYDDTAFALAATCLVPTRRIDGLVYSFDHEVETIGIDGQLIEGRSLGNNANKARWLRYKAASRNPSAMRALVGPPLEVTL